MLVLDVGTLLTPFEKFSPGRVIVRGDRIEAAGVVSDVRIPHEGSQLDFPDLTLVPGFIEPHLHGCGGFDVMDATADSMNVISRTLARYGTTSFLPTTVRSEEHTSELQSQSNLVCRLLLEKKKNKLRHHA